VEPAGAIVILLGAGAGRRLGAAEPKALLSIGGRPMLGVAAAAAAASPLVGGLVVAFPTGWEGRARAAVDDLGVPAELVEGGDSRQASVGAALAKVPGEVGIVAVHDAARPFASPELFARVVQAVADGADGAVPVLAVTDTVLRVRGEIVEGTVPREELALGQTPQAFRTSVLREAHAKADVAGASFTDDASMLRWAGFEVRAISGDPANVKITTIADLAHADRRMAGDDG
jgi:2-C-methyl-D-erythritol 4-phosphate cytidylyltransferase / 2-C-methyl-D-erythritol 2,4-cyclodiphosphate synthase